MSSELPLESRKEVVRLKNMIVDVFSESNWMDLAALTGTVSEICENTRLFKSLHFQDDDYDMCALVVLLEMAAKAHDNLGVMSEFVQSIVDSDATVNAVGPLYNLFVSAHEDAWSGAPLEIETSRCVREYTDDRITARFGELDRDSVRELSQWPSIFAYETGVNKAPKFGLIRDVISGGKETKVVYDIIEVSPFVSEAGMQQLRIDLGIRKGEMNRTHWAVKEVDLSARLGQAGIYLPAWARAKGKPIDLHAHKFQVAFSFPGEHREYVEQVVRECESKLGRDSCFYDFNYQSQLGAPDIDLLLQQIYSKRSELVVVFICEDYQRKTWCGIEFKAIRQLLANRESKNVMYVRMDDGSVDGVFPTDGFVDAVKFSSRQVADFVLERVALLE